MVTPSDNRTLTIPSVSVPDVQLSAVIDDAAIAEFIAALNAGLADVVGTVDAIASIPGQTLLGVLDEASTLNTALWTTLIDAAGGPTTTLGGLLYALSATSEAGFSQLLSTVGNADLIVSFLPGDVTDIIGSTLIGSLSTALYALADVVNNPLALSSYTGLLSGGVDIAAGAVYGGVELIDTLGGALLGWNNVEPSAAQSVSWTDGLIKLGIGEVQGQINIALGGLSGILSGLATASDSQIVAGVVQAIQGLAITPISAVVNAAASTGNAVVDALRAGFFTATDIPWYVTASVQQGINGALTAIGDQPLSPASYTTALSSLISGGFGVLNTGIIASGDFLHIPVNLASSLTETTATLIASLTTGVADAVSGLLTAVGLPEDIAGLPVALAVQINQVISDAKDLALGGLTAVNGLIDDGVDTALAISYTVEETITGALTAIGEALTPEAPDAGAGARTALVNVEVATDVAVDKEIVAVDDSTIKDETSEGETSVVVKDSDLTETPSTGGSDSESSTEAPSTVSKAKEKREAAKAERAAAKAERTEKRQAAKAERAEKRTAAKAERASKRESASSSASAE
ncbi:hypothetical protein AWB99_22515 [Mycolicibacterium confluentis]|nr:hypothetical protein AWB99_22515 [Mycolicibacterium confluentis]